MLRIDIAGSYYELGLAYGRIVSEKGLNCWWEPPTVHSNSFGIMVWALKQIILSSQMIMQVSG